MRTYADYRARRYLPELDGLRAISILLVFTTHVDALLWERLHGSTGVTVFFVLSGYLITTLGLREEERTGRLDLRGFYLRRIFRIYPLYAVVLALYAVLVLGLGMAADRRSSFASTLPYYLGFLPERALLVHPEPPFSGAWSLGIEEKFYFVWPLLGFVLLAGRLRPRLVALAVAVLGFAAAPLACDLGHLLAPYALIALGCLAALLLHDERGYAALRHLGRPVVLAPLLVGLLVVQVSVPWITLGHPLYVAYGVPVVLALVGILASAGPVPGWLSARPLVFLGRISYAFYLTHNFALNAAQGAVPDTEIARGLLAPLLALPIAIAIAWLLHVGVERPLIAVGHRLAARRRTPSVPAAQLQRSP